MLDFVCGTRRDVPAPQDLICGADESGSAFVLMVKVILPLMKGRSWGRIVKTGSAPMVKGVGEQTHYVAAEASIFGFSRSLARAVGIEGNTMNLVIPGLTLAASVVKSMPQDFVAPQGNARVIQRDETAENLVGAVFSLASPDDGSHIRPDRQRRSRKAYAVILQLLMGQAFL